MPELPEVEIVRYGLNVLLPGRTVEKVEFNWRKSFPNADTDVNNFLIGAKVEEVTRRAKALILKLSSQNSLVTHLKMTGQLVFVDKKSLRFGAGHPSDSLIGKLPDKSTHVIITFKDGSKLFFNDQRKFGWMRLLPNAELPQIDFFKKLGPEPLNKDFTWKDLKARLNHRPNTKIKSALLDQSVIAGIGNIYSDESLWSAKIHPATQICNLPDTKIKKLYQAMVSVLMLAIEKGGSTDKNYVDAEGRRGSYLLFANVFRREGQVCSRCGTLIIKIRLAGRGTHLCPKCQRLV
jgi:formamidopyrimidine-DNA glycosylase